MKRWVCPKCGTGVLAPERLARLDVRRWCLRCSAKSTTLIERSIPSKLAEQARAKVTRQAVAARRRAARTERAQAFDARCDQLAAASDRRRTDAAAWLRQRIPLVLRLPLWAERMRKSPPEIVIRQGGVGREYASGHAWCRHNRLVVTTGLDAADDLACLVHEVAHLVDLARTGSHGPSFRALEAEAIGALVGRSDITPARGAGRPLVAAVRAWLGPADPELHAGERVAAEAAQDAALDRRGRRPEAVAQSPTSSEDRAL